MKKKKKLALSWIVGLLLFADYCFLAFQDNMSVSIPVLVCGTALGVILLAVLFYLGEKEQLQLSPGAILSFALASRLLFLFQPPQLSDDIYRYLWDGLQILHGNNPYSLAPAASTAFDAWSSAILNKVNHPQFFTIYPPSAQIVFAAGVALARDYVGLKIILVAFDMATCAFIIKLLHTMNLPTWRAVLYAWHPLPIIEIAWSGHIDGAAILFLFAAISLIVNSPKGVDPKKNHQGWVRRTTLVRHLGEGTAIALSILMKPIPLIYLPLLLCATTTPLYLVCGCFAVLVLFSAPFLPDMTNMFVSLGVYLQNWEFANAAFRILRSLLASGDWARVVLSSVLTILILAITLLFRGRTRWQGYDTSLGLMESLYLVTVVFLLLTPTLHPWYALYLAALLPFSAGPAGLVLSWAVFLSYHIIIRYSVLGEWVENDLIVTVIWLSPALAWFSAFAAQGRRRLLANGF